MELTAEHDGRMVADMVAEWADLLRRPFALELEASRAARTAAPAPARLSGQLAIDAVEFVRILSGRAPGTGLLAHALPL